MKILPGNTELAQHIDYYWIVLDASAWFMSQNQLYAFPGITPELILILEGQLTYEYLGQRVTTKQSILFGFLHGDIHLDFSQLKRFIVVVFKNRGLASVTPFLPMSASAYIKQPVQSLPTLFQDFNNVYLPCKNSDATLEMAAWLDDWLHVHLQPERSGFIADLAQTMPPNFALETLREYTNYSVSTLVRYFKKETGLSPKQFQKLHRFRAVIEHLYATKNGDWGHYVETFGFYDQSHFIKEIRAFTGLTPSQLLNTPGILPFRPK